MLDQETKSHNVFASIQIYYDKLSKKTLKKKDVLQ